MGIKNRKGFTVTSPNGVSVFSDRSGKKHKNKQTKKILTGCICAWTSKQRNVRAKEFMIPQPEGRYFQPIRGYAWATNQRLVETHSQRWINWVSFFVATGEAIHRNCGASQYQDVRNGFLKNLGFSLVIWWQFKK